MLYMNNEKSLLTVFLLCLAMYKVKSELSMAGSGGNGDTARYTGMDNYIFVVRGFQMTELKSLLNIEKFSMFKFIVQNFLSMLTSESLGGVAVI